MEALTWAEILSRMFYQLIPVWIALIATFSISIYYKRNLGLYGKLFDSPIGMIGFGIVLFWAFVGFFAGAFDMISTHDPLSQVSGMKNKVPGTPFRGADEGDPRQGQRRPQDQAGGIQQEFYHEERTHQVEDAGRGYC